MKSLEIKNHKPQGEWKIHWTIAIKFISSKDSNETRIMDSKSDSIEFMMGSETDESLLQRYQEELEESMEGSGFIFDSIDILYYNLNKLSLNRGGSYIDSPEWLKNKKATINPKNNEDKRFQYTVTVALNHQNIKNNPERITKINPFINQLWWLHMVKNGIILPFRLFSLI